MSRNGEHNVRCLHQTINDGGGQTNGTHRGSQCNEDVDLLVELGVDRESGEGLSRPLTKADVADVPRLGDVEDIRN